MITFIPHRQPSYSPTEIKNAVKSAYYEIQQEEAERKREKEAEERLQAKIKENDEWFINTVGEALANGEEVSF